MTPPAPNFCLGDAVFVADAHAHSRKDIPCPICAGKLVVTLILGSGERQPIECEACQRGYQGPAGTISRWAATSAVYEGEVTGLALEYGEWRVSVGGRIYKTENIFHRKDEAEGRRAVLFTVAEAQAQRAFENQFESMNEEERFLVRRVPSPRDRESRAAD